MMNTDRLIAIRKALKLNQDEFGERLGLKRSALSMIESNANGLTEKNIKLIGMVFNVNEDWLRTGQGEMFVSSPYEKEFFEIYRGLMPETQAALVTLAKQLLETQKKLTAQTRDSG
jgi:transcriptional regulator with XRE-family HTH domain